MREIRFRAWDKKNKKIVYDNFLITPDGSLCEYDEIRFSNGWYNITNYILMQDTGIKDKNGKKIYEGDVISCRTENSTTKKHVEHEGVCFGVHSCGYFIPLDRLMDLEVVGNIYENKELLK